MAKKLTKPAPQVAESSSKKPSSALLLLVNTMTILSSLTSLAILAYQMLVPPSPVYVPTPVDCSPESFLPQLSINLSRMRENEAKFQNREAHLQLAVVLLTITLVSVAILHFYHS